MSFSASLLLISARYWCRSLSVSLFFECFQFHIKMLYQLNSQCFKGHDNSDQNILKKKQKLIIVQPCRPPPRLCHSPPPWSPCQPPSQTRDRLCSINSWVMILGTTSRSLRNSSLDEKETHDQGVAAIINNVMTTEWGSSCLSRRREAGWRNKDLMMKHVGSVRSIINRESFLFVLSLFRAPTPFAPPTFAPLTVIYGVRYWTGSSLT